MIRCLYKFFPKIIQYKYLLRLDESVHKGTLSKDISYDNYLTTKLDGYYSNKGSRTFSDKIKPADIRDKVLNMYSW